MSKINKDLFRGHVDTIILKTMQEKSRYGYDILSTIQTKTNSIYEIKQSTLYNILNRLEAEGLVSSFSGKESKGGKRKYYKLTDKGKEKLKKEQSDWEFSRTLLDNLVSNKKIELTEESATFDPNELRPLTKRKQAIEIKAEDKEIIDEVNKQDLDITSENNLDSDAEGVDELEVKLIVEEAANKLQLGSGHYGANFFYNPKNANIKANTQINLDSKNTNSPIKLDEQPTSDNYKATLDNLFKDEYSKKSKNVFEDIENLEKDLQKQHFNDLKHSLSLDGFKLKIYNKANYTQHYYMKYIYTNTINKDAFFISSLIYVLTFIFLSVFYKEVGFKSIALPIISIAIFTLIPIYPIILHNINPNKKIKNNFSLTLSLIRSSIFLAVTFAILTIIQIGKGTLTTQLKNIVFYIPLIYILYISLYFLTYSLLLKKNKYYANVK